MFVTLHLMCNTRKVCVSVMKVEFTTIAVHLVCRNWVLFCARITCTSWKLLKSLFMRLLDNWMMIVM